jgi:uncharacterized membrane protein
VKTQFVKIKGWLADNIGFVIIILLAGGAYAVLSVIKHQTYHSSGFDLGIQDQIIWSFSHFRMPGSTIEGFANAMGANAVVME